MRERTLTVLAHVVSLRPLVWALVATASRLITS